MLNRRRVLTLGGLTVGGAAAGLLLPKGTPPHVQPLADAHMGGQLAGTDMAGMMHHTGAVPAAAPPPPVTPFTTAMPVSPVLRPVARSSTTDFYRLAIRPANLEIFPGTTTPLLTYGGLFPGPTIRARTGRAVQIVYTNGLADGSNVHLHGGYTPQDSDGYSMDIVSPGASRTYRYPNLQQGATLWYHDHAMGFEADHLYRGLQGFYVLEDDAEAGLRLPSGEFDVPIMLRDAHFDENAQLVSDWPAPRETVLTNGKIQPYFPVAARKYRFRLLNAANERLFKLNLDGAELIRIGSDGGLLPAPVPETELSVASGERTDFVVDFGKVGVGKQLVLSEATAGPVLRFDVVRSAPDPSRVPAVLRPLPALPPATVTRDITMSFDFSGATPLALMNGKTFDPDRVDYRIKRGTTEIWRIHNADAAPLDHTFHVHLVQFHVVDRGGKPLLPVDAGRKDTVFVAAGESVAVQATFGDYLGKYVFHCHFIEHSVMGMMGQLEIVP
ncbi:multicopper oxidase family protein [Amycolatopsis sp. NEAU-NG30]|uniref:Multicopper oxidase CueO n=1 Tax=Amycolatopsis melonis TaxID=3156488 RepID=A0ABV0LU63_9PSEU